MTIKSKSASVTPKTCARRKSIDVARNVAANIIFIDLEIRSKKNLGRWEKSVFDYRNSLAVSH